MYLVAFRWTLSNSEMFSFVVGDQVMDTYSSRDLTSDVYRMDWALDATNGFAWQAICPWGI